MSANRPPHGTGADTREPIRVGLISDTHGWLDPRAVAALEREEPLAAIIHAGDIGASTDVFYALEAIAPVTAVLGNCDVPLPGLDIPALARLTVAGVRILVIHDRADLGAIPPDVDVVVRGHSHIPSAVWEEGVLIANPGSASQRRSQPGCTVGVLQIAADGRLSARTIELDDFGERVR